MNKKQKLAVLLIWLRGLAAAVGANAMGILLLTVLILRRTIPAEGAFWGIAVLCVLSTALGGLLCVGRTGLGALPTTMLVALAFAAVLLTAAVCCGGICWMGEGGGLLFCTLSGGVLAGLIGSRMKRKRSIRNRRK